MAATVDTLRASLAFLNDAAHLLTLASPQTAAHLMAQRNTLLTANNVAITDFHRQHACTSCGHIMVPGHGDSLRLEAHRALRKRSNKTRTPAKKNTHSPKSSTSAGVRKRLYCSMCDSYTDITTTTAPPITRRRAAVPAIKSATAVATATATPSIPNGVVPASSSASPAVASGEAAKGSMNASSRKRAKSRKQGLQALLQQSRSSTPQSGLGLSLADFMKK